MKSLFLVAALGLGGGLFGCTGAQMGATHAPCPNCTVKETTVYNSKHVPYRTRTDYTCSVCKTTCNLKCPFKCQECANRLACCSN